MSPDHDERIGSPIGRINPPDLNALILNCQKRMMAGDHTAITELNKRLAVGLIGHFLRRLGGGTLANREAAEELAHRTWIEFWKALQGGTYDPSRARPSTFLYAVAANIWLRYRREQGRDRSKNLGELDDLIEDEAGARLADPSHLAQSLDLIRRVVNGDEPHAPFADNDRQIMKWIADGHTERDIAGYLGISPSTAHARKQSLLEKLGSFLRGRGVISKITRAAQPLAGEE